MSKLYRQYMYEKETRRRFLKKAGAVSMSVGVLPGLLAACGGSSDDGGDATTAASTGPAAAPKASGQVDFLSWEGYDLPDDMKPFKTANNVTVKATYIANHNDIQAKLKGGAKGVDLITYYQGYKPLYDELKLLEPLDEQKLPNLKGMLPLFAGNYGDFWVNPDGTRTGVPWTWGAWGITYDSAEVSDLTSWFDLLDPKFKGKVGVVDDFVAQWTLGARVNNLDVSKLDQAGYAKVTKFLEQMAGQSRSVAPSFGDMTTQLVNGDIVACWTGWGAMDTFAADAGKKTVKTTGSPKEGTACFCDAYAIPPGADNQDTTLAWINEAISPDVNASAAKTLVGGVTVEAAVAKLDPAIKNLYPYDDLDAFFKQAPLYNNPPIKSDEYVTFGEMQKKWEEIKSQAA